MKNFELLRRDWASFSSGQASGIVFFIEAHNINIDEDNQEVWISPIGQPDIHLCPGDFMEALGLDEEAFNFMTSEERDSSDNLVESSKVSGYAISTLEALRYTTTGNLLYDHACFSFRLYKDNNHDFFAIASTGTAFDEPLANDLDDPFHYEP